MIRSLILATLGLGLVAGEGHIIATPSLDEIKKDTRSFDTNIRHRAQGLLFYLEPNELAEIRQSFDKFGGVMDGWPPLMAAEICAGMKAALADAPNHIDSLMPLLSNRELAPVCDAVTTELQRRLAKDKRLQGGTWTALAARTSHAGLTKLVFAALIANPNMEAYPQPAATWIPLLESLPPATDMPTRVRMLQRAKPGFAQPPPACLAGLLHDHEPQIRRAAANLLSGSSEPTVLKLANELASDADPGVRQAAANSIITFRPQPPAEALSAMCEDPRWEAWHRANAWTQRFQRPGKDLIEASKRQFVKKDCEPFVLQAIAGGLANAGEQSWVIERITGLDPTVQASVLLRLLSHADNRVLDAVQGQINGHAFWHIQEDSVRPQRSVQRADLIFVGAHGFGHEELLNQIRTFLRRRDQIGEDHALFFDLFRKLALDQLAVHKHQQPALLIADQGADQFGGNIPDFARFAIGEAHGLIPAQGAQIGALPRLFMDGWHGQRFG